MKEKWVYVNGSFLKEKDAFIPITDRGFLFGEGLFTTIRVDGGKPEFLEAHLRRLRLQAEALYFHVDPFTFDFLAELINRNLAFQGLWRLKIIITVKGGSEVKEMGALVATIEPFQDLSFHPSKLTLFPHPIESPLSHIKSLAYLDHLYLKEWAKKRGYTDAIAQTRDGLILETGSSNLFWIDKGKCWIPDTLLPYLKGVFLQSLLPHLTWPIEMARIRIDQLSARASVYMCNALTHVRPVMSIDQMQFHRCQETDHQLHKAIVRSLDIMKLSH